MEEGREEGRKGGREVNDAVSGSFRISYAKLVCDGWMDGGRDNWLGWVGSPGSYWVFKGERMVGCMYVCMYVVCFDGIRRGYSAWESAFDGRGRMREDG